MLSYCVHSNTYADCFPHTYGLPEIYGRTFLFRHISQDMFHLQQLVEVRHAVPYMNQTKHMQDSFVVYFFLILCIDRCLSFFGRSMIAPTVRSELFSL